MTVGSAVGVRSRSARPFDGQVVGERDQRGTILDPAAGGEPGCPSLQRQVLRSVLRAAVNSSIQPGSSHSLAADLRGCL
jgi:hypothetical protein